MRRKENRRSSDSPPRDVPDTLIELREAESPRRVYTQAELDEIDRFFENHPKCRVVPPHEFNPLTIVGVSRDDAEDGDQ